MAEKPVLTCSICGKEETLRWDERMNDILIKRGECFTCNHWMRLHRALDQERNVRVNGKHYRIAPETGQGFRGFGGAGFEIVFHDGRSVKTTNLWHQGTIPERFHDLLPDNAIFITKLISMRGAARA